MIRTTAVLSKLVAIAAGGSSLLGGFALAAQAQTAAAPTSAPTVADRSASLNIAPLRIELDGTKSNATVMLTNTSERPIAVQVRLFAWSQEAGEDRYAPSTELTVSPSITTIAPGTSQVVRLLRLGPASAGEKRFRLAVDQLPDPALAQAGEAEARLRFTIPVFLDRDQAPPAALEWRITGGRVQLSNSGGQTVRIAGITVKTASGQVLPVERNALRYAQGGSTIEWDLVNGCAAAPVTITAQIDGQMVNAQVTPNCG